MKASPACLWMNFRRYGPCGDSFQHHIVMLQRRNPGHSMLLAEAEEAVLFSKQSLYLYEGFQPQKHSSKRGDRPLVQTDEGLITTVEEMGGDAEKDCVIKYSVHSKFTTIPIFPEACSASNLLLLQTSTAL